MYVLKPQITCGRLMKIIKIGGERTHRSFPVLCTEQDKIYKVRTWDIDIAMSIQVGDHVLVNQDEIIKLYDNKIAAVV
ncbi:MAG: hypothetical protein MPEBLZ_01885 [Candidatus Methanoperedens nitroreducens]|uniref:Uncharacterized protein n=2 Tax=Candidatus Methanoperedens TaxID=1392997 RepID=A0A0P8AA43_9EURY|nr:MAG: hypothetical protein MPEBLZ_01885 [Candidatus Methanoperedens sp. BLZ1]MCX9079288.1 hypothetical protein [Candidatus Methanoperedens sp.]